MILINFCCQMYWYRDRILLAVVEQMHPNCLGRTWRIKTLTLSTKKFWEMRRLNSNAPYKVVNEDQKEDL